LEARIEITTPDHIGAINKMVRKPDKDEIWASCLRTPDEAMNLGLRFGKETFTGIVNNEPICVWGVVDRDIIFKSGVPWMVGSELLDKYAVVFLRRCKKQVMKMFENYDNLENHVDARNILAIKWLQWLGFTIHEPKPYGALELPFHKFTMRRR
jgi:hypothetical protein